MEAGSEGSESGGIGNQEEHPPVNPTCQMQDDQRFKPGVGQVLRSLGLDVSYDRARGDFVYYSDQNGTEIEVLDLIAGYGTLLLGHNHPAIVAEATRFLMTGQANHVQGSRRTGAEQLAGELTRRTGRDDIVIFANSGTEAVEAAIKHAMLETRGATFLALEGAFHGKSLGALQLTANPVFRDNFAVPGINVIRIRPNDIQQLDAVFERVSGVAGFVFEPILGEGGVRPLLPKFAERIVQLCRSRNVPAIADECQTGMGRTGALLASHSLGIHPDYVILSKALGGGLAKISALMIDRRRYRSEFDLMHTSTFADDGFSCSIAHKTLDLVNPLLLEECHKKGAWLLDQLNGLRQKHPTIIAEVRGAGLMLGIALRDQSHSNSFFLRQLSARQLLGVLVAGHLLKSHRIRIAPTLSDPLTLRVQPSALIREQSLEKFVGALSETCVRLEKQDVIGLTEHLSGKSLDDSAIECDWPSQPQIITFQPSPESCAATLFGSNRQPPAGNLDPDRPISEKCSSCFAWMFHLIDADDVPNLEPALTDSSPAERDAFLARMAPLAEPIVMPRVEMRSAVGACISLWPILLPVTSAWLKQQIETRRLHVLKRLLNRSIDVAESLGAELVSLGQFTSIVSSNGRNLVASRIGLTTGNSYTTALIVQAVRQAQAERGIAPQNCTLAVVGAAGNIGRACAEILGPDYRQVILIGRDRAATRQQLRELAHRIGHAKASWDLGSVGQADVVVCATNCLEPVLGADHLRPGAIICDASIPSTVRSEALRARPDLTLFQGGIVRLPHRERLNIPGLPLPPGQAFGCLAEGAILCFEGVRDASYTGPLCPEKISRISQLAARHGFGPAITDRRLCEETANQKVEACISERRTGR